MSATESEIAAARESLESHLREIIAWHFSPETGCPYWLGFKERAGWNPLEEIHSFADLRKFEHFEDAVLRDEPNEDFIPKAFEGRPFRIFETGGTTGLPKQRIGWEDYKHDYEQFSHTLPEEHFPLGSNWIMVGPTGPRRLRLAIEYLANLRGGSCYYIDLDPRWVKRCIQREAYDEAEAYQRHVVDQAVALIKGRHISCMFTTPRLLESIAERISLPAQGLLGVFCGGTTMTPQMVRFLVEEVCENTTHFVPTYGNTLMGLAHSRPLDPTYSVTYYAPQPRAVLRVVDTASDETVPYGEFGRIELTTLTREFFVPRFLERDEAERREPYDSRYPWDGVGDVRPFQSLKKKVIEGVY